MKCLVTGGSGFLGSHVADELTKKGHTVIIFDLKKSKWLKLNQKMIVGNMLNYRQLNNALKKVDYVLHFAGLSDLNKALNKPIETIKFNILATANLLKLSLKNNIKRIIFASSIYAISSQGGFYRCSKRAAEDYIEEYQKRFGIDFSILRYGSLYGNRSKDTGGINEVIYKAIKKNKISYVGSKKTEREYIHVRDAAKMTVETLKPRFKNKHIIISGKKKIKVYKFLKVLSKELTIKKIHFTNKKKLGHYITNPNTFKVKKGKKFLYKNSISLKKGLKEMINEKE